jgi:RNA polymerase sigma-70 factor (family 1)
MQNKHFYIDSELLIQLREGDEKAFSVVFDTYHRYLYVLANRYLMNDALAEDAVQFTFMRLWEGRETFDYKGGIKNLLYTILKNHVLNEIRHNNLVLQKNYELAQLSEEAEADFLQQFEADDFKKHFYRMIEELPPQKREVCMLKVQKGLSNQEVADTMQISVPTVKSHYTQVIKLLRSKLEKLIVLLIIIKLFFNH